MRRWLIPFLGAIVVLAIGYAGLWLWAEHELGRGFSRWAAAGRSSGWQISCAPPRHGTSPLAATLVVPDLTVAGGDDQIPGGLAWHAERVVIEVSLLHPRVVVVRAHGAERLRFSGLPDVPFTANDLHALVPLQLGEPPRRVDIEAANLSAGAPASDGSGLSVTHLELHVQWPQQEQGLQPSFAVAMRASDLVLPGRAQWPLGPHVALVTGDAAFNGQMPRAYTLAERAAAWRDAGGQLRAQRVTLTWGALNLSGNATLSLDHGLQPTGSGTARVVDPSETLNALAAHGVITRRAAFAANAVLALMEHVPEGGGSPVVEIPVTVQDRTLSVGNIPLAKLPEIVWPDL